MFCLRNSRWDYQETFVSYAAPRIEPIQVHDCRGNRNREPPLKLTTKPSRPSQLLLILNQAATAGHHVLVRHSEGTCDSVHYGEVMALESMLNGQSLNKTDNRLTLTPPFPLFRLLAVSCG